MERTKGKWTIETPCGFPYSGLYIVPVIRKDFPYYIAKIRELREREESEANAEFIIQACNSHDKLVEALEHIIEYWNKDENNGAMSDALWHILETAKAALEGE